MDILRSTPSEDVPRADCRAVTAFKKVQCMKSSSQKLSTVERNFPSRTPSLSRRRASLNERPIDLSSHLDASLSDNPEAPKSILYLAYASNLCAETFLGKRGIRPLSQVNVVVPELVMTFDLPGLPYTEPCFANTAYRSSKSFLPTSSQSAESEKAPLLPSQKHTDSHWPKGLVGVVYEVTPSDFAHIIATEGGGASYQDILVDCHPLPEGTAEVPAHPTTPPFKAHTLFDPASSPDQPPSDDGGRISRPNPGYAQPSARYLKLIADGADEHGIPAEYKQYLHSLQPYTITSNKQRLGRYIFMTLWFPLVMAIFGFGRLFQDNKGKSPAWLVKLTGAVFRGIWASYDGFFRGLFGDGERTVEEKEVRRRRLVKSDRQRAVHEKDTARREDVEFYA